MSFVLPEYPAELPIAARFKLLARCHNCWRVSGATLPVPAVDDAPRGVDELLESGFLARMRFECDHCDGTICSLVGASPAECDDDDAGAC